MNILDIYAKVQPYRPAICIKLEFSLSGVVVELSKHNPYHTTHSFYVDKCANFGPIFDEEFTRFSKYGN